MIGITIFKNWYFQHLRNRRGIFDFNVGVFLTSSGAARRGLIAVIILVGIFIVVKIIILIDDALLLKLRQLILDGRHRRVSHRVIRRGRGEWVVCGKEARDQLASSTIYEWLTIQDANSRKCIRKYIRTNVFWLESVELYWEARLRCKNHRSTLSAEDSYMAC